MEERKRPPNWAMLNFFANVIRILVAISHSVRGGD